MQVQMYLWPISELHFCEKQARVIVTQPRSEALLIPQDAHSAFVHPTTPVFREAVGLLGGMALKGVRVCNTVRCLLAQMVVVASMSQLSERSEWILYIARRSRAASTRDGTLP